MLKTYGICIHRPTKRGWTFDRQYRINDRKLFNQEPPLKYVEKAEGHLNPVHPDWCKDCEIKEFDTYWYY